MDNQDQQNQTSVSESQPMPEAQATPGVANTAVSPPIQPTEPHGRNWKKWIFIGFALVILTIGGGTYALSQQTSEKVSISPTISQPSPNPNISYEPIPTINPTIIDDWKLYTNTDYNLSFKYPPELIISPKGNGVFFSTSSAQKQQIDNCLKQVECYDIYFGIQFTKKSKKVDLENFLNTAIENDYQNLYKAILIDGKKARAGGSSDRAGIGNGFLHISFVEFDTFILDIQAQTSEKPTMQTYQQILSTFKFTEQPTQMCVPRPACLDADPPCLMPEPANMCLKTPIACPAAPVCKADEQLVLDDSRTDSNPQCPFHKCIKK